MRGHLSYPLNCFLITLALFLSGPDLYADDYIDLEWGDLLPERTDLKLQIPQGILDHDQGAFLSLQPSATGFRTDWNGKIVRLPGFVVPLDFSGKGVKDFILVPYVGACIHVPPPPANQLVLVSTITPYQIEELFDPVYVTGMINTVPVSTELGEIGYMLSAENIEPYIF